MPLLKTSLPDEVTPPARPPLGGMAAPESHMSHTLSRRCMLARRSLQEVGACAASWQGHASAKAAEHQRALADFERASQASLAAGQV